MKTSTGPRGDRAGRAFTVLELMVVVLIVAVLILWLLPVTGGSRQKPIRIQCVNNLKQIGLGFRIWQQDNGEYPMQFRTNGFDGPAYANQQQMFIYFQVLSNEVTNPKLMFCPEDKKRSPATDFSTGFNSSHVSYFAGLNADEQVPMTLLAGDRNIVTGTPPKNGVLEITTNQVSNLNDQSVQWTKEIHKNAGNVLFADSHVEQLTSKKLREALLTSSLATNRLVLP
jgi:prepilin-type processing-associated H-X9-DG protein/prepilin-type N-terminal cleavage/methylation domain-containing protein